jgi:hypothetical protein
MIPDNLKETLEIMSKAISRYVDQIINCSNCRLSVVGEDCRLQCNKTPDMQFNVSATGVCSFWENKAMTPEEEESIRSFKKNSGFIEEPRNCGTCAHVILDAATNDKTGTCYMNSEYPFKVPCFGSCVYWSETSNLDFFGVDNATHIK